MLIKHSTALYNLLMRLNRSCYHHSKALLTLMGKCKHSEDTTLIWRKIKLTEDNSWTFVKKKISVMTLKCLAFFSWRNVKYWNTSLASGGAYLNGNLQALSKIRGKYNKSQPPPPPPPFQHVEHVYFNLEENLTGWKYTILNTSTGYNVHENGL